MALPAKYVAYPIAIAAKAGRFAETPDYERYIVQLIKQVLLTSQGERINRIDFGASVRKLLFSPLSQGVASFAETMVFHALTRWLGDLIKVDSLTVVAKEETLEINVSYVILARGEKRYLTMEVTP